MKNYLVVLLIVLIDQVSKFIFTGKHVGIINYTENTGGGFSILQGYNWLFIVISVIVLVLLIYYYGKFKHNLPLLLIMGGVLGNLIDRVFFGAVRDFIDLKIWPIFNLADSFNVIGVILLVYFLYKEDKRLNKKSLFKKNL